MNTRRYKEVSMNSMRYKEISRNTRRYKVISKYVDSHALTLHVTANFHNHPSAARDAATKTRLHNLIRHAGMLKD